MRAVELRKTPEGDLRVVLNVDGLMRVRGDHETTIEDLLEHHLANGWELLRPDEIGALTSCPLILADTAARDDAGVLTAVERVYWHERYQVDNALRELVDKGFLVLEGVKCQNKEEP
jgi:hypothetical protein